MRHVHVHPVACGTCRLCVACCMFYIPFSPGATGAAIANPTDLIKVRLQAQSASLNAKTHYKGTVDAFCTILKEQGR